MSIDFLLDQSCNKAPPRAKTEETNKVNGLPDFSTENQATEPERELKIIQLSSSF